MDLLRIRKNAYPIYGGVQNYFNTDWSENIDFVCLQNMISCHNFHEICIVALSQTNIRWSELYYYYPLLTLTFGMSTFFSDYINWYSVNIFPENINTNVIPCLLQLKPKAFLWMYNRSVQFIFQLAPSLLDGVEVWTLRCSVHHFQCSGRFLPSQVFPTIVSSMGIVMANSIKTTETSSNAHYRWLR